MCTHNTGNSRLAVCLGMGTEPAGTTSGRAIFFFVIMSRAIGETSTHDYVQTTRF